LLQRNRRLVVLMTVDMARVRAASSRRLVVEHKTFTVGKHHAPKKVSRVKHPVHK